MLPSTCPLFLGCLLVSLQWAHTVSEPEPGPYSSSYPLASDDPSDFGSNGSAVPGAGLWKGNPTDYTIGGVLSGLEGVDHHFIQVLSDVVRMKLESQIQLKSAIQNMDTNPIKTAITVCSELIKKKVYAIVVSKPRQGDLSPASVSYTAGFYHIPVIGISSRDSAFSDKNIHVSFLRTVPPYSHQADVWVELLKAFKYRQLIFLHSSDTDGRALLGRFQTQIQDMQTEDQEVKVEKIEEFEPGRGSYRNMLHQIKECQARVFFLYASTEDADQIFSDAHALNMTGAGYVWMVTEQALLSKAAPSGTLGLKLVRASDERAHISDSLNILSLALLELHKAENVTEAPSNCNTSGNLWETGKKFFEYIRKQILSDGLTGRVAFDGMGDRIYAEYDVFNIQKSSRGSVIVGSYKYSKAEEKMQLSLNEDDIIWPGGLTSKPTGLMIPTHLNVLTIQEKPFVYARRLSGHVKKTFYQRQGGAGSMGSAGNAHVARGTGLSGVMDFIDESLSKDDRDGQTKREQASGSAQSSIALGAGHFAHLDEGEEDQGLFPNDECAIEKGEIPCPLYERESLASSYPSNLPSGNRNPNGAPYCCRGYCIDLLRNLAEHCNFTYSLQLSRDEYGSLERNNQSGKQEWTGLIGELVKERADLIVAPLTINPERAQVMEFSKPFKYQGITILQKRQPRASQLVSFLQPFKLTLWVLVLVSVHVVALCLYLLDRFSPFGRLSSEEERREEHERLVRLSNSVHHPVVVQKEESLNFTSAIWFAWGVLLNSGIGEGTPRSFSARVLGMVWAGFAMIIVASYTANLAAFLVLDKPQTSLTGINDPRLRNPMENFTYATVKGSSVDMYFRRQVELSNMYRTMEGKHYKTPEEAIQAVKTEKLHAFIWDSSRLEFEASRECDLITAGDLFGRSGYGIGLQKGSPWADKVTLAILDFHESGKMEDLDNGWILLNKTIRCDDKDDNSPATLGLNNMRGVFILVGGGIVGGIGLIIIEIAYKKHQIRKQKRLLVARTAINRWRGNIERRRSAGRAAARQPRCGSDPALDMASHSLTLPSSGHAHQHQHLLLRPNGLRAATSESRLDHPGLRARKVDSNHREPLVYLNSSTNGAARRASHDLLAPSPVWYEANRAESWHLSGRRALTDEEDELDEEDEDTSMIQRPTRPNVTNTPTTITRHCMQHPNAKPQPQQQYPFQPLGLEGNRNRKHLQQQQQQQQQEEAPRVPPHQGVSTAFQMKSPSSSDSSRKRPVLVGNAMGNATPTPSNVVIISPRTNATAAGAKRHLKGSTAVVSKDSDPPSYSEVSKEMAFIGVSSASTGQDPGGNLAFRDIPKPPPPPKAYWQQKQQSSGAAHHYQQYYGYVQQQHLKPKRVKGFQQGQPMKAKQRYLPDDSDV